MMVVGRRRQWIILLFAVTVLLIIFRFNKEQNILGRARRVISRKISPDRSSQIFHRFERRNNIQKWVGCENRQLMRKSYRKDTTFIVENLFIGVASERMGCAESITYTTTGNYGSLENLQTIAEQ